MPPCVASHSQGILAVFALLVDAVAPPSLVSPVPVDLLLPSSSQQLLPQLASWLRPLQVFVVLLLLPLSFSRQQRLLRPLAALLPPQPSSLALVELDEQRFVLHRPRLKDRFGFVR